MGKAIRLGAVLCWCGAACGCGDSPNMTIRDTLNARNELVDALLKVNDDASAKTASATELKKIQKRWEDGIRKRVEELQKNLDLAERAVTKNRKNKAVLAGNQGPIPRLRRDGLSGIPPDLLDRAESLVIADEVIEARDDEIKATAKRMAEQISRLNKLLDQLRSKEIADQKARGIQNPTVNAAEQWPNLTEILKAPQGMCGPKEFVEEKSYTWQAPLVVGELPPNLVMLPKR